MRGEGQVYFSSEVAQIATLVVAFMMISRITPALFQGMREVMRGTLGSLASMERLNANNVAHWFLWAFWKVSPLLLLLLVINSIVATLAVMLQTQWNIKSSLIRFRFSALNPVAGLRRILSPAGFFNTLKAVVKLALVAPIAYFAIKGATSEAVLLPFRGIEGVLLFSGAGIKKVFWRLIIVFIAIAAIDYVYGKYRWHRQNNMTKQEVKDEQKNMQGDEATKRKMISKARARLVQKLASAVPKADVIITNPTHFVALRYDRSKMNAPEVVAKGTGYLALRIRELAREAGVPIVERKPLARALYASVKVGQQIPAELYRAVAEVLGYVYRVKGTSPRM
jgi:flagellar biosynthetic protein FlhB